MTKIKELTTNPTINLALDTVKMNKQGIVLVNSKRGAEKTAEDLSKKMKLITLTDSKEKELFDLSEKIRTALSNPTKQCKRLAECIKKGVAFHHAGLTQKQKELIEDSFRDKLIKIICATPTLTMGVDLPAFRAIIKDLRRYSYRGLAWIPVLEYQQFCGRAGRPKFDDHGEAIAIASSDKEKEKIEDRYVFGESEEIYSKLAVEPVLRTYVLSLIASEFVNNENDLVKFFEKTFWAFQYKDMDKLTGILQKMISLLEEFGFITTSNTKGPSEFISANEINKDNKLEATMIGKRVAQLYIDPLTANEMIIAMKRKDDKLINEFSFVHLVSNCLEIRPQLKVKTAEYEDIQQKLAEFDSNIIVLEPSIYDPDYDYFLNSIKTALFFHDWIEENDDEFLLEKYDIRPGEIRAKLDRADWLLYSAEELARMQKLMKVTSMIKKTRFRLRYGVKEELIPLLKLKGIGRVRARKLFNNKIKDVSDVKKADIATLAQLVGKATTISIKKQVGQDIDKEKVPEKRRKGQISLNDY